MTVSQMLTPHSKQTFHKPSAFYFTKFYYFLDPQKWKIVLLRHAYSYWHVYIQQESVHLHSSVGLGFISGENERNHLFFHFVSFICGTEEIWFMAFLFKNMT